MSKLPTIACEACGLNHVTQSTDSWKLRKCSDCNFVESETVVDYQRSRSNQNFFDDQAFIVARIALKDEFTILARRRLKQLASLWPLPQKTTLLEVGASAGEFIALARDEYGMQVTGMELATSAVAYCREKQGLEMHTSFESLKGKKYDIVSALHVIEHVLDINEFARNLAQHVSDGGALYIRTPNIHSAISRVFGTNWPGLSVEHTKFLSKESTSKIFEKHGLHVVFFGTESHGRYLIGAFARMFSGGNYFGKKTGAGTNAIPNRRTLQLMRLADVLWYPMTILERKMKLGDELVILLQKK